MLSLWLLEKCMIAQQADQTSRIMHILVLQAVEHYLVSSSSHGSVNPMKRLARFTPKYVTQF